MTYSRATCEAEELWRVRAMQARTPVVPEKYWWAEAEAIGAPSQSTV